MDIQGPKRKFRLNSFIDRIFDREGTCAPNFPLGELCVLCWFWLVAAEVAAEPAEVPAAPGEAAAIRRRPCNFLPKV